MCHDNLFFVGWGESLEAAFNDWDRKQSPRTRIPRAGVWERRGCRDWWRRGCPPLRTYFGHRQIVGYLPASDELVLRG